MGEPESFCPGERALQQQQICFLNCRVSFKFPFLFESFFIDHHANSNATADNHEP